MLHALAEYAMKHDLATPPGFARKKIRWAIWLDESGNFVDVLDLRADNGDRLFGMCPELKQGELITGGVTRSHFLWESTETIALLGAEKLEPKEVTKAKAKHAYFLKLLEEASASSPVTGVCARYLSDPANLKQLQDKLVALKVKPKETMTFRVGTRYPIESDHWHQWWGNYRAELRSSDDRDGKLMRCFQTGELVRPLETHPKIMGLAQVGGLSTGCVLIGFDKESFTSYGLVQSANAAVSDEAATIYRNALNDLITTADRPIADTLLVYWFKEPVPDEDNPLPWVNEFDQYGEAEELEAMQRARKLVEGIRSGNRPDLANNTFYAMILSASGGRVMVREWLEGSFEELAQNIGQWFDDLSICSCDGSRKAKDPGIYTLMRALVREDFRELSPSLVSEMWRAALFGRPIPRSALWEALHRLRVEIIDPAEDLNPARLGLIKSYLIRRAQFYGGDETSMKVFVNEDHPSVAYQAGRLMAVLAAIQKAALGDVGAGVIQRYYAAASTTPALVFGRLIRQSQFHISKLDKGLAVWYERILADITVRLGDNLPSALDLEGQSLFALGFYQQMAVMYAPKNANLDKEEITNA